MYRDKRAAQKGTWRVSENTLLLNSFLWGSVGIGIGMLLFRHKTQKNLFTLGVPFTGLLSIILTYLVIQQLKQHLNVDFILDIGVLSSI